MLIICVSTAALLGQQQRLVSANNKTTGNTFMNLVKMYWANNNAASIQ
jgi:hypothetical protein